MTSEHLTYLREVLEHDAIGFGEDFQFQDAVEHLQALEHASEQYRKVMTKQAKRIKQLEDGNREFALLRNDDLARIKQLEAALRDVMKVAEAEYCTLTDGEHGSLFKWHEPFQRAHKLLEDK